MEKFPLDSKPFYPGFIHSAKEKGEFLLWRDIFNNQTNKYIIIGSGEYLHVYGKISQMYNVRDSMFETFENFLFRGQILIHDADKKFLFGTGISTWDTGKNKDSKNPMYDYLFEMPNGKIAKTDADKNECIERILLRI